ncbi:MAG: primosomal protein N' [Bacilli bacterium]
MFAKIVVEVPSENTDELYTYRIPNEFSNCIFVGSRVFVEFGFQKIMGYVLEIIDQIDVTMNVKDIIDVIDFEQGLTFEQIELATFIKQETKSFFIQSLDLMYPSFLKSKVRKYIEVINFQALDAELALIFGSKKKVLMTRELLKYYSKIKKEINLGNIAITSDVFTYGKRKLVKFYSRILPSEPVKGAMRQNILDFLSNRDEASEEEIIGNTGCSQNLLKKLIEDGYLRVDEKRVLKEETGPLVYKPISWDFEKQMLKEKYQDLNKKPFLLFTNDEQFKLDFLLNIAIETIEKKKQVLIITPTILTNTLVFNYFSVNIHGCRLLNFSSRLSNSDYYDNYWLVKEQNADIVIGTKQSAFLPLSNIGLIIVIDEESPFYVNEQNPKYQLSEIVRFRSEFHQSKLVFTSSVPKISTYYQYYLSNYYLLEYRKPSNRDIMLVNMREELEDLVLSKALKQALKENISQGKKSLLILNSLGYSPITICSSCGRTLKCEKCEITLTYHKGKGLYRCPYCGETYEEPKCSHCGGHQFQNYGVGLEKLKERLLMVFPDVRLIQVDSETMVDRSAYERFLTEFENDQFDIIIGTSLLLSLISQEIGLVGVINADNLLNYGDYRSLENVFSLIAKLRDSMVPQVFIQGMNLEHEVITKATTKHYEQFYEQEILKRQNLSYPPFVEINRLVIIGDYREIYHYANYFKKVFKRISQGDVLGPVYLSTVRGVQLIIKHQDFVKVSRLIDEVNSKFKPQKLIVNFERYPLTFR